jgi:hypothetical protein
MEEKKIGEEGNARKNKSGQPWGCPDEFISVS